MKETENYKLSLIEASDTFSTDILNDNAYRLEALFRSQLQYVTGSYVGTGKSGTGNPCRIEFPFKPLLVVIAPQGDTNGQLVWLRGMQVASGIPNASSGYQNYLTWEDRALQWYTLHGTRAQLNDVHVYYYFAVGLYE